MMLRRARMVWNKFKSIILSQREFLNNPENWKYLEYYAEEMIKLRNQNGLATEWSLDKADSSTNDPFHNLILTSPFGQSKPMFHMKHNVVNTTIISIP
jgi:hypothetical protein